MVVLTRRSAQINQLRELRQQASARDEAEQIVIFGRKLIGEWIASGGSYQAIYRTCECPPFGPDDKLADSDALEWASGLVNAPREACAALIPRPANNAPKPGGLVLVLDGVQDPGNVGTLIRSAAAFHFDALVVLGQSCDPFNDKAIRASMGACLYLPLWRCQEGQFLQYIDQHDVQLLAADISQDSQTIENGNLPLENSTWIVIGSEGTGISPAISKRSKAICLPMHSRIESLNAAVAGSILAYLAFCQRRNKL